MSFSAMKDQQPLPPLQVCGTIPAPITHEQDMKTIKKYLSCPLTKLPPKETTILLLDGVGTYGRTGNNLIEFLHALQYAKDHNILVGIVEGSWATQLITEYFMAIQDDDIVSWRNQTEQAFCIKILIPGNEENYLNQYKRVIQNLSKGSKAVSGITNDRTLATRDLFKYRPQRAGKKLREYHQYQSHILRTLFRYHNTGVGV